MFRDRVGMGHRDPRTKPNPPPDEVPTTVPDGSNVDPESGIAPVLLPGEEPFGPSPRSGEGTAPERPAPPPGGGETPTGPSTPGKEAVITEPGPTGQAFNYGFAQPGTLQARFQQRPDLGYGRLPNVPDTSRLSSPLVFRDAAYGGRGRPFNEEDLRQYIISRLAGG